MSYDYEHYSPDQSNVYIALKIIIEVTIALLILYVTFCIGQAHGTKTTLASIEQEEQKTYHRHDSLTVNYTHDGESIRYYVMIDPDTNIQYLVNDRGGMCVREGV